MAGIERPGAGVRPAAGGVGYRSSSPSPRRRRGPLGNASPAETCLPYLGRDVRIVVESVGEPAPAARLDGETLVVSVRRRALRRRTPRPGTRCRPVTGTVSRAEELLPATVDRWLPRAVYYRPVKHPSQGCSSGWGTPSCRTPSTSTCRGSGTRAGRGCSFGDQKTLWGSCAYDGTIRINWRTAMLEPALIDYIVVHELAHIDVRNHSEDFWELADALSCREWKACADACERWSGRCPGGRRTDRSENTTYGGETGLNQALLHPRQTPRPRGRLQRTRPRRISNPQDGRRTRWGKFLRADGLHALTPRVAGRAHRIRRQDRGRPAAYQGGRVPTRTPSRPGPRSPTTR